MGAPQPLPGRLLHDHRGAGRPRILQPAGTRRGSDVRHQDHGGSGRMARSNHRRDAQSGDGAARAHATGDGEARLPAQLHQGRSDHHFREPPRRYDRERGARHLGRGAAQRCRHAPHPSPGHRRPGLQRHIRRHLRHHLRLHRGRVRPSRASRLRRGRALQAAASAGRVEDRDPGRPGRENLRRVLDAGAGHARHRQVGADPRAPVPEHRAARRHDRDRGRDHLACSGSATSPA